MDAYAGIHTVDYGAISSFYAHEDEGVYDAAQRYSSSIPASVVPVAGAVLASGVELARRGVKRYLEGPPADPNFPVKSQRTPDPVGVKRPLDDVHVSAAVRPRLMHDVIRKFGKKDVKFYDVSYERNLSVASTSMDLNPAIIDCISAPAQGDTINNRNGHVIYMKSIEVSGVVYANKAESFLDPLDEPNIAIWIVLDRQTNGAKKIGQNILSVYGDNQAPLAFPNLYYEDEFHILAKRHVVARQPLVNEGLSNLFATNALTIPFHMKYTFPRMERVIFNGSGTEGIASVIDNSIQVFGCANATQNTAYVRFNTRLLFYG